MMNKHHLKSHQIFHIAKKTLSDGELHRIFGKSTRLMYMWSADERSCEITRRNPLEQIRELVNALDDHSRIDVARVALEYMAGDLPLKISSIDPVSSDKQSIDGEIADLTRALGRLATVIETAQEDGAIETDEIIRIKRAAYEMKRGVDELLDAAGIKAGV